MQLDMKLQPALKAKPDALLWSRWKRVLLYALVIGGVAVVISQTPRDFSLTLEQSRPFVHIAALVLSATALWGMALGVRSVARRPGQIAWRMSARLIGWAGLLGSAGAVVGLGLQADGSGLVAAGPARAVELVVPLILAVQAALIFSPDDEAGLEVLLACPRPAAWLLMERVALLGLLYSVVALAGVGFCRLMEPALDVPLTLIRWLPSALLLGGVGVYVTLRSRVAAFGAVIAGLVWFVFAMFGSAFLPGMPTFWPMTLVQPYIWAVNPYLQPGDIPMSDYWLNRLIVAALGVVALMASVRQVGDEERLLLNGRKGK